MPETHRAGPDGVVKEEKTPLTTTEHMQTYGELLSLDGVWSSSIAINKARLKQGGRKHQPAHPALVLTWKLQSFLCLGLLMLKETKATQYLLYFIWSLYFLFYILIYFNLFYLSFCYLFWFYLTFLNVIKFYYFLFHFRHVILFSFSFFYHFIFCYFIFYCHYFLVKFLLIFFIIVFYFMYHFVILYLIYILICF